MGGVIEVGARLGAARHGLAREARALSDRVGAVGDPGGVGEEKLGGWEGAGRGGSAVGLWEKCGTGVAVHVTPRNDERTLEFHVERPVGKGREWLVDAARASFGVEVLGCAAAKLEAFAAELIRWNRKVNLTSIVEPSIITEKHLLDSLAVVSRIPAGVDVLDAGTGGGFPGLPLAIVRPDVRVLLVDSTEKKVLFLKTVLARLDVSNAGVVQVRMEGHPDREGLERMDVAVSRAFVAPEQWLRLGAEYVRAGGRVVAMLGAEEPDVVASRSGVEAAEVIETSSYRLPSGDRRGIVVRQVRGPATTLEGPSREEPPVSAG